MCLCGGHDVRLAPREKDLLAHRKLSVVGGNLRWLCSYCASLVHGCAPDTIDAKVQW
jgi:hypothetical protein